MSERSKAYLLMLGEMLRSSAESIVRCYLLNLPKLGNPQFKSEGNSVESGCCLYFAEFELVEGSFIEIELVAVNTRESLSPTKWRNGDLITEAPYWDKLLFYNERGEENRKVFDQPLLPLLDPHALELQWSLVNVSFMLRTAREVRQTFYGPLENMRILYHQGEWNGIRPASPDDFELLYKIAYSKGFTSGGSA